MGMVDKAWINKDDVYRLLVKIESVNNLISRGDFIAAIQGETYRIKEYKNPKQGKKADFIEEKVTMINRYIEGVKSGKIESFMMGKYLINDYCYRLAQSDNKWDDVNREISAQFNYTDEEIKINIVPEKYINQIFGCSVRTIYRLKTAGIIKKEICIIRAGVYFGYYDLPKLTKILKESRK